MSFLLPSVILAPQMAFLLPNIILAPPMSFLHPQMLFLFPNVILACCLLHNWLGFTTWSVYLSHRCRIQGQRKICLLLSSLVIVNAKLLKCHSKAKHRAPAYSASRYSYFYLHRTKVQAQKPWDEALRENKRKWMKYKT